MKKNKKIAYITLRHKRNEWGNRDRLYVVEDEWDSDADNEDIFSMWERGNYGCDCNRSLFIQRQVNDKFPEFPCGDKIDLVKITIKGKKQVTRKYRE